MVKCALCPPEDARPPLGHCVSCDKAVCAGHRWAMLGLCHDCATEEEVREGVAPKKVRARDLLDIKWIE